MTGTQRTTEFVFLAISESVKPEDPDNARGQELLKAFQEVKGQEGCVSSGWGRTEEDGNSIVWITEWSNENSSIDVQPLKSLIEKPQDIVKVRTNLQPPLSEVGGLDASPCVDVTTLTFKSASSKQERDDVWALIQQMKKCVTQDVPPDVRPSFYSLSTIDTFPEVTLSEASAEKADVCVAVVGWTSRQQHLDVWKTDEFKAMIPLVRSRLLPYPPGMGMKHANFNII